LARLCFDAVLPEHFMRTALWMIVLFAGLAWPALDAPAQKNEGLGVLGPTWSSSSSPDLRGSSSRRSRHSPSTRRRATDKQDAGESPQQGEPATEQPSDKKSRNSPPARRRARDKQDAGESPPQGEPATEQPSDKK
jgi:hypothetical protein